MAVTHPVDARRNSLADTAVDYIDAGATFGTLVFLTSGAAEVATLTFSDPAFGAGGASVVGRADADTITKDSSAAGGITDNFETRDSNGVVAFAGSVSTIAVGTGDIQLSIVDIPALVEVEVTSLTYLAPP